MYWNIVFWKDGMDYVFSGHDYVLSEHDFKIFGNFDLSKATCSRTQLECCHLAIMTIHPSKTMSINIHGNNLFNQINLHVPQNNQMTILHTKKSHVWTMKPKHVAIDRIFECTHNTSDKQNWYKTMISTKSRACFKGLCKCPLIEHGLVWIHVPLM